MTAPEIFDYFDAPFKYDPYSGKMFMSSNSGLLVEVRTRGWGKLTGHGSGGNRLDEKEAAAIQDEFSEWFNAKLNEWVEHTLDEGFADRERSRGTLVNLSCHKCGGECQRSTAFVNADIHSGVPDFPNSTDPRGQTMSLDRSKATQISCMKCTNCGHSFTVGDTGAAKTPKE